MNPIASLFRRITQPSALAKEIEECYVFPDVASRIGARLRIWSRPGAGTEVDLRMPAGHAYRPCLRASRWSWLRAIVRGKPA